ncbi:hypothetical protein [Gracilibacillus orientalis]|uniref:hypothetical protein n=1 Tax=Gracilibacillus orientalis TaxID=334253 RepID=UPI000B82810A|nr:hypothetical protein [Gracilibacillus orientalis]
MITLITLLSVPLFLNACQSEEYQGKYVEWSDQKTDAEQLTDRLEDNDTPYKIEDAVDDAVKCCS